MRRSRVGPSLAAAMLLAGGSLVADEVRAQTPPKPTETRTIGGHKVDLWLPPAGAGAGPRPLVLFSHGVSGCRDQSAYLMVALAGAGRVVAAPDHDDERCGQPLTPDSLPLNIAGPDLFQDSVYAGRREQL